MSTSRHAIATLEDNQDALELIFLYLFEKKNIIGEEFKALFWVTESFRFRRTQDSIMGQSSLPPLAYYLV